jgi:hypothetical protein
MLLQYRAHLSERLRDFPSSDSVEEHPLQCTELQNCCPHVERDVEALPHFTTLYWPRDEDMSVSV